MQLPKYGKKRLTAFLAIRKLFSSFLDFFMWMLMESNYRRQQEARKWRKRSSWPPSPVKACESQVHAIISD